MILFTFVFACSLLVLAGAQVTPCAVDVEDSNSVTELDPPGTAILRINATQDVTWTFSIHYGVDLQSARGHLEPYLTLERQNDTGDFVLKVNRTLDLEQLYADWGISLSTLSLKLQCQEVGQQPLNRDVFLTVEPVNEFEPQFTNKTFNVHISEFTGEHYTLIQLSRYANDRDVNPSTGNEIRGFFIEPFNYSSIDGKPGDDASPYFAMGSIQLGNVELVRPLDYDQLFLANQTVMYLNVTVTDQAGNTTWATVVVTVVDYDDLSPEFYYSGCPERTMDPCLVIYFVKVLGNTTGPVNDIDPAPIFARDRDAIDNPVTYTLRDGARTPGIVSHLEINQTTGTLTVVRPFQDLDLYTVFVVAEEVSRSRMTALATLQIDVYSPAYDPALTTTDTNMSSPGDNTRRANPVTGGAANEDGSGKDGKEESSSTEKVAVIGMAVLGVLVLVLVVALFIVGLALRKLRIARVTPEDESPMKSAPYDEETASQQTQSTSGDGSPSPDQDKLLSSLPEAGTRGNTLPPLQPGATSNDGPNQVPTGNGLHPNPTINGPKLAPISNGPNPDVFDGTRSFQMGLNPEFFTTPGKTKVPREADADAYGLADDGQTIVIND